MADAATQAAYEAMWEHVWPGGHTGEPYSREEDDRALLLRDAEVAVAAARPIIEAEVRERIAAEIESYAEATHDHVGGAFDVCRPASGDRCDLTAAYRHAARIARGGAS